MTIHPLTEIVAQAVRRNKFERTGRISAFDGTTPPTANELDDANAAIRAVREWFETDPQAEHCWKDAVALLKEVENG